VISLHPGWNILLSWQSTLFAIAALTVLAFAGAPGSGAVHVAQAQPAAGSNRGDDIVIQIGSADNGGTKSLRVGELFQVTLPENPTTGYRWELHAPAGPVLEVVDDSFARPTTGLIGAGGLHSWRFKALREGLAVLTIDNRRSWEPSPIGAFKVTIDVKAQ
jgi:inhibitor of cysteine peptidase